MYTHTHWCYTHMYTHTLVFYTRIYTHVSCATASSTSAGVLVFSTEILLEGEGGENNFYIERYR